MNVIDLSKVPNKPGCYLWKDKNGEVIYVGKAKQLRNRMRQYFLLNQNPKTNLLVKNIADFDYLLLNSELDSLLVELQLINKYSPKYNIKLKETQSYPYLAIRKNPMLAIEIAYKINRSDLEYFGPFPEGFGPRKIKKIIESIYPIDKCLRPNSGSPCLNYQLGLCPGYCFKKKSEIDEDGIYADVKRFLKGDIHDIKRIIKNKMQFYSDQKLYERAQKLYEILNIIKKYDEKQRVYFSDQKNRDIIAYDFNEGFLAIAFLFIRFGKLINQKVYLLKVHDLDYRELLRQFLYNYYQNNFHPHELIIDFDLQFEKYYKFKFSIPNKGIKFDLLQLAKQQAKLKLTEEKDQLELKILNQAKAINDLQKIINIKKMQTIEFVDISHFQGKNTVGAVVNFSNFYPNKNLYRKYKLQDNPDDYYNIYMVTYRHFRRKLINKEELPDLYIVDGKSQLNYALKALNELEIADKLKIIGLIKNSRHDTKAIIDQDHKISNLPPNSDIYVLLGGLQDEIHRFVLAYQRQKNLQAIYKK